MIQGAESAGQAFQEARVSSKETARKLLDPDRFQIRADSGRSEIPNVSSWNS